MHDWLRIVSDEGAKFVTIISLSQTFAHENLSKYLMKYCNGK
jgi:hypothetical protein